MYAVGVILFIILSGYHPFDPDGLNTPERMQALMIKGLWSFDDLGVRGQLGTDSTSTRGSGRKSAAAARACLTCARIQARTRVRGRSCPPKPAT